MRESKSSLFTAEESIDINLVYGPKGLAWNIFKKSTNENCFLDFQKTTIPSLQCHPETIELIEKIKTETFDNMPLLYCLMTDFKVRVTEPEELKANFNKEQEKFLDFQKNYHMFFTFPRVYTGIYPYIGYGSAYLFRKNIISVATFASKLFSNRILGTTAGLFVGFYSFCFFGSLFPCLYWLRNYYSFIVSDTICKKEKALRENTSVPLEGSLLIEIEPISSPSRIDKRMGVSKFMWAVTLITHKGSEGNHAKIIVEGINDGFYSSEHPRVKNGETIGYGKKFTYMTEFNPPIKSKIFSEKEELLYETRTEIWMKTSNEVKKMLENIEEEKRLNSIKFKFLGASSLFYIFGSKPYHNCFTWAKKHLKTLNIDLGKGYMDVIGAIVKGYTIDKEEYETDLPALQLL